MAGFSFRLTTETTMRLLMSNYTIQAENLPSKAFSLSFKEPSFGDRREVSRRYPARENPGYSLDELLLANSITAINNNELSGGAPFDPLQLLREMPQADEQFALMTFLSMFTLDEDQMRQAEQLGEQFKYKTEFQHTIKKEMMPRGSYDVTFRKLMSGERMALERKYPGADSNCGYSFEEMLCAASITHIDGAPVEMPREPITLFDDWKHVDAQFVLTVFINTVTIDRQEAKSAKQLGKLLLEGMSSVSTSTNGANSSKKGKVNSSTVTTPAPDMVS